MHLPTTTSNDCFRSGTRPTRMIRALVFLLVCVLNHSVSGQEFAADVTTVPVQKPIVIGSKSFNEGRLLGEILAQRLELAGFTVTRKFGLAGTLIAFEALRGAEIDLYSEYTGTLSQVILKLEDKAPKIDEMNRLLAKDQLQMLGSFGFNNTYAISLKESQAIELGITKLSELKTHPQLRMAFSHEFLNREDGWPGLNKTYQIGGKPTGIEHALAYQAIDEGKTDITDAYSTDGDLARYHLAVLEDDKGYFPEYFAAPLVRSDLPVGAIEALGSLAGRMDDDRMRALNAEVVIEGKSFAEVAQKFLKDEGLGESTIAENELWQNLITNTITHLELTAIALTLGCLFGLSTGILVFRSQNISRVVVYIAGLLQTIPSLALLALMIPLFGIGKEPAIIALFLYSILPILRNTITALVTIDPVLKRVAEAIGLTRRQQLWHILLPLAMPNILAGVKTAAVISIGTATLAAFVGAGGLGEPIITGLNLNNTDLILQGAIPAACLAILVELLFEYLERLLVKPHMLQGQLPQ
ncbi:MAG TPA: ABC transporter permease subunit [Gammaproteobacteria bacterium]|nr:ABC transporter permease subunit [Gammaproteobacteria bacterium]